MKNKKVKKNIQFLILVLIILGLAFSVFAYTKNELRFKYFNRLGIAKKNSVEKERYFNLAWNQKPEWALIEKSNKLDILYQEKKYEELKKKIGEIEKNECSLEKKEISEFCENIFYLGGLVEYQLGQKDKKKKEEFNQKAIFEFQKTLAVNPKNIWAKENIEFLLKRQQELKKQKEEQKQGKGQDKKDDKNQKGKSEENDKQDQKNRKGKKDKEKQNGKKREGKDDQQKDQKGQSGKENNKNKESRDNKNQGSGKSRLPSQIQRALEQEQKKLEQQQKNQKGFSRTRSKAEQNREQNQNPFSAFQNDPFFQDFFGNDPFFNQVFGNPKKNLRKDLGGGEDEKDW